MWCPWVRHKHSAYDVECALREHVAPARVIAAVLRELLGQRAWPRVAGVCTKFPVDLGQGARQGGSGTSMVWNSMISAIAKPLLKVGEQPAVG